VGQPVDRVADDVDLRDPCHRAPDSVDQPPLPRADLIAVGHDRLEGGGGRQRGRHVLEAGCALVDALVDGERVSPPGALAHQQHTDARGPAPLVRRRGRRAPAVGQRQPARRRARVGEQGYAVRGGRQRGDGLQGADLVIRGLDGEHGRALRGWRHLDPPEPVDRQLGAAAGPLGRVHDGTVLDGRVRDAPLASTTVQPEQPEVHRRRARSREGDLVRPDVQRLGHHRAGVVEQESSGPPGAVESTRVGIPLVEGGEEGLARRGVQGLGRCGVEISAAGHGLKSIRPAAGTHPRIRGAIRIVCR
jgi:hypothetical protein